MSYFEVKRKVFISHFRDDRAEVDAFVNRWCTTEGVFTPKVLGANNNDDFIDSTDTNYVMSQIRQKYLGDSTVTIVLIGQCTHSRRYVDWEIKSSLTQGTSTPNGLIGILLPSMGTSGNLPPRFRDNWNKDNHETYARYYSAPSSATQLNGWIEDAFSARTNRSSFIKNTQDMMKYNAQCAIHGTAH